jgi:DNA-directed RNA polymerase sigma subunit (sigma70/sigma32)
MYMPVLVAGLLAASPDATHHPSHLREIGEVLGVSESRVCQLHGQAVTRLRDKV